MRKGGRVAGLKGFRKCRENERVHHWGKDGTWKFPNISIEEENEGNVSRKEATKNPERATQQKRMGRTVPRGGGGVELR